MTPSSFSTVSSNFWRTRTRTNDKEELTNENIGSISEDYPGGWSARCALALGEPVALVQSDQRRAGSSSADRKICASKIRTPRCSSLVPFGPDLFWSRFAHSNRDRQTHRRLARATPAWSAPGFFDNTRNGPAIRW